MKIQKLETMIFSHILGRLEVNFYKRNIRFHRKKHAVNLDLIFGAFRSFSLAKFLLPQRKHT